MCLPYHWSVSMLSHQNQGCPHSQWWYTYHPLLMNHPWQYHNWYDVLVPNQVLILADGHGLSTRLLVMPFSAVFCSKGAWYSFHSCLYSRSDWWFGDGLVSDNPMLRWSCHGRVPLMGYSVGFCVIKCNAPYNAYTEGACGENPESKTSQKNGVRRVVISACSPDKVGSFRIRSLQGVGVAKQCSSTLHIEDC